MELAIQRRAQKAARLLTSQISPGGLVLLYHRVIDPGETVDRNRSRLCVEPRRFSAQMEVLRQTATPLSASEMIARIRNGEPVSGCVAVTFDDGYLDNLEIAAPILEDRQIPATFFVVSGNLGRSFWWDDLVNIVSEAPEIPMRLEQVAGKAVWHGGLDRPSPEARRRLLKKCLRLLRSLSGTARGSVLEDLRDRCGVPPSSQRSSRSMGPDELQKLSRSELFEIGAHSHSHPQMSSLSSEKQRHELASSKAELSAFVQDDIQLFAYPHGQPGDFSRETMQIAKSVGYEAAFSAQPGVLRPSTHPYRLPRLWIGDCRADQFEKLVRRWLRR